jgi:hypothetical protein
MASIEQICDRRALIFHRFLARRLKKDPMLAERARAVLGYLSGVGGAGEDLWNVVYDEWDALLRGGVGHLREMLPLRSPEMDRLRTFSPFLLVDDPITREIVEGSRLWQLARRGLRTRGQVASEQVRPVATVDPEAKCEVHNHYHFYFQGSPPEGFDPGRWAATSG